MVHQKKPQRMLRLFCCTKECLTRKCRAFFCCSISRRHDLVQRRRYSNRAAARSAVRNATVRRSLARGRVPDGAEKAAANVAAFCCTKECLTRKCRAFFCCSILRRHDLVHRRRYSNRAAARSVRNATVRRSLARGSKSRWCTRKSHSECCGFLLPKNALHESVGRFLLLYFKKARSGAASEILEQGGGTQCCKGTPQCGVP